jgi:hypothetical protein
LRIRELKREGQWGFCWERAVRVEKERRDC